MSHETMILGAEDAVRAAEVHAAAFGKPWSAAALHDLLAQPRTLAIGLEQNGTLTAFISVQFVGAEADIQTLAVHSASRRQGLASTLLGALHTRLQARGVSRITLDVAEDNHAACALYTAHGYQIDGTRPAYYKRSGGRAVDGVLMSRSQMTTG